MTELEFYFKTEVDFTAPVNSHVFTLHCLPVEDAVQQIQSYSIRLEPQTGYALHRDGFANWQVCGAVNQPHDSFIYSSHGIVRVDHAHRVPERVNPVLKQFTPLTMPDDAVLELWRGLKLEGKDALQQAQTINRAAAGALHYVPGMTDKDTPATQALTWGMGVCQDYTHLLLSLARLSGFAARYCMGLIPGEGATHAWAELALPQGWVGFDPTQGCPVEEDYVRFAVGRDAADCRVERGVMRGSAAQTMRVDMELHYRK